MIRNLTLDEPHYKSPYNALVKTAGDSDTIQREFTYNVKSNADLGFYDAIKHKLTERELSQLIDIVLIAFRDGIANDSMGIELPSKLGIIICRGTKEKSVNFMSSSKFAKKINYTNSDTDGYVFSTYYKFNSVPNLNIRKVSTAIHPYIFRFKSARGIHGLRTLIHKKIIAGEWQHWNLVAQSDKFL